MILEKLNINQKDSAFYKYDYSNFDKDNFASDFAKINWNENKNTTPGDVNVKFYNFYNKVSICVKRHVTLIKLSRKQISLLAKPWITVRIESMMAKRDKYLKKCYRTHSLDLEYLYKKFRNKVVSEIRKIKNITALNWFSFSLTDRKHNVSVNGHTSDHLKISCGIPHDSITYQRGLFSFIF